MANIFAPGPKTDRLTHTVTKKTVDDDILSQSIDSTTQVLTAIYNSLTRIEQRRVAQGQAENGFLNGNAKGASDEDLAQTKIAVEKGIDGTGKLMRASKDTVTETPRFR